MKIYDEISLKEFKPWGGAVEVFNRLTDDELDIIESEIYENEPYEQVEINDMFWFEDEWILETLGIDYDEFWKRQWCRWQ